MRNDLPWLAAIIIAAVAPSAHALAVPTEAELVQMLAVIDDRQANTGDYRSTAYLEQKERGKEDTAFEVAFFRRDADDKLMILFTKPKTEAGKGYLRLDKNLFFYDPTVGKWERRTERERIGGTSSNRQDFDESRLAQEYTPKYVAMEKLGKLAAHHVALTAKADADVAYPLVDLWLDQASGNVLKREDKALSGKLLRTTYYPKWNKVYSESKKADVYFPGEIRIYDEVEKGNSSLIVIRDVDLRPLDANLFTKAWLESKSR
ncbi:MAG: outer membrane lipoprotein-sorting protein [Deltaproteobacteria bacterium RBG_16_71_12]|nr:MAG: outer membrane lipoprotein-sorting protein [Deltaproteobacteria bacterium RBG_16_71_12]